MPASVRWSSFFDSEFSAPTRRVPPEPGTLRKESLPPESDTTANVEGMTEEVRRVRRMDRAKSRFLATVSHELRTPLTAIDTYAEALLDEVLGELNDGQRDAVGSIQSATRQLLSMVDEILTFSRSSSEGGELTLERFPVGELVAEVHASHESLIRKKGLDFRSRVREGTPALFADRAKATQVLANLLANAIDFTPSGGEIEVRAGPVDSGEWARLEVEDTGVGVPPEDRQRIFEKFVRGREADRRRVGGTGLGLSIASQFVELHGGEIGVESTVGEGSCFHFTLPTRKNESFVAAHRELAGEPD